MTTTIAMKSTHVLTIDDEAQYVTAIAYRPQPAYDAAQEGEQIAPRIATAAEVETGKAADGCPVIVVLARLTIAARLFDRIEQFGYDGDYLGSTDLRSGPLGGEWSWSAGMLLSNGEPPRANLTWSLAPVRRTESGDIAPDSKIGG
jgi:hypothetical protein